MEAETQVTSSSPTDGTTQPQAQPGKRRRKARPQVDMPTDYARILEIIQSPYLGHYLQRKGLLTRKVLSAAAEGEDSSAVTNTTSEEFASRSTASSVSKNPESNINVSSTIASSRSDSSRGGNENTVSSEGLQSSDESAGSTTSAVSPFLTVNVH
ncbi:hypothetical protein SprV_0401427400 [Sparganum proliferum]